MKKLLPRVLIVGRTNVGKSTLFNRLANKTKALALDQKGVTRDFLIDSVSWRHANFELIDTGGISIHEKRDELTAQVFDQVQELLSSSDIILFMVDAAVGVLPEDVAIAKTLHRLKKNVFLVINKEDTSEAAEHFYEFGQLGFEKEMPISAYHGKNIDTLLDDIVAQLPSKSIRKEIEEPTYSVVLLGKPNVGKSSLMNLLLKQKRAIVAEKAGTTREPITQNISFYKEHISITDTPGIRRKKAIDDQLEKMMVKTAFKAIDRADIVLLLIDGSEAKIADQELKLAFYAFEKQYKALIILINKTDLVTEEKKAELLFSLEPYEHLLKKVEVLYISCKTDKNIGRILPTITKLWQRYNMQFDPEELNILIKEALIRKPLFHKTGRLHVFKVKQIKTAPATLIFYVNHPKWFGPSQFGYFENIIRKQYDLKGVPLKFIARAQKTKQKK